MAVMVPSGVICTATDCRIRFGGVCGFGWSAVHPATTSNAAIAAAAGPVHPERGPRTVRARLDLLIICPLVFVTTGGHPCHSLHSKTDQRIVSERGVRKVSQNHRGQTPVTGWRHSTQRYWEFGLPAAPQRLRLAFRIATFGTS